jgi:hypothetical protein
MLYIRIMRSHNLQFYILRFIVQYCYSSYCCTFIFSSVKTIVLQLQCVKVCIESNKLNQKIRYNTSPPLHFTHLLWVPQHLSAIMMVCSNVSTMSWYSGLGQGWRSSFLYNVGTCWLTTCSHIAEEYHLLNMCKIIMALETTQNIIMEFKSSNLYL